jgi:polyisoprenyl-phosphate glycosyltransferase
LKISIIIPVYKGELTIERLFSILERVLIPYADREIIFVHDCGSDKSWDLIKKIHVDHPSRVKAIKLKKNFGQHIATTTGLVFSEGDIIVTIDEDLQYNPEDLIPLFEIIRQNGTDLIYGIPDRSFHGRLKKTGSSLLKTLLKWSGSGLMNDYSSLRVIKRDLADKILESDFPCFFIDAPLNKLSCGKSAVKVPHYPRESEESSYTVVKLAQHAIRIIIVFTGLVKGLIILDLVSFVTMIVVFALHELLTPVWQYLIAGLVGGITILTCIMILVKKKAAAVTFRILKEEPGRVVKLVL